MANENTELTGPATSSGGGTTIDAFDRAHGKYQDKVADSTDAMSKLPQSQLPQGVDPSPFKLGGE